MHNYNRITHLNDQLNDRYVAENAYEDIVTFPKLITLTTTLRCNYRCWMCYQNEFKGELDWHIIEKLKPAFPYAKTLQLFGGEPLLYSRIEELCKIAADYSCDLEVITNGSLLNQEKRALLMDNNTTLIKISMEAARQKTYTAIRGGDLAQVLSNIKALADEKSRRQISRPIIQINFVGMRRNIEELPNFVNLAANAGVERLLVLFMNCGTREDLAKESLFFYQELADQKMNEALELGRKLGVEISVPGLFSAQKESEANITVDTTCHSPWKNCLVSVDGQVNFCCGGAPPLGNIHEQNFDALWNSKISCHFRKFVNTDAQPDCCITCRVKSRNFRDISFHIRNAKVAEKISAEMIRCKQSCSTKTTNVHQTEK